MQNALSNYTKDDLQYTCYKLYEAGYVVAICADVDNNKYKPQAPPCKNKVVLVVHN